MNQSEAIKIKKSLEKQNSKVRQQIKENKEINNYKCIDCGYDFDGYSQDPLKELCNKCYITSLELEIVRVKKFVESDKQ